MNQTVATILGDLRPYLPQSLQRLSDDRLLALVNWSIMAAWGRALKEVQPVTSSSPLRREVRVCPAALVRPAADTDRLITLLAAGLERWLTRQAGEDNVDFLPEQSVTTTHEDNDVFEGYR